MDYLIQRLWIPRTVTHGATAHLQHKPKCNGQSSVWRLYRHLWIGIGCPARAVKLIQFHWISSLPFRLHTLAGPILWLFSMKVRHFSGRSILTYGLCADGGRSPQWQRHCEEQCAISHDSQSVPYSKQSFAFACLQPIACPCHLQFLGPDSIDRWTV